MLEGESERFHQARRHRSRRLDRGIVDEDSEIAVRPGAGIALVKQSLESLCDRAQELVTRGSAGTLVD